MRIAGDQCDADLAWRNRGDVDLKAVSPVKLHVIRPWLYAVMTPETVAARFAAHVAEGGGLSHPGILAIRAHQETRVHPVAFDGDAFRAQLDTPYSPEQRDAHFDGTFHQQIVKNSAAHAESRAGREIGIDRNARPEKTNAAERESGRGIDLHSQLGKRYDAIGHQALSAGLIDGRQGVIGDDRAEALLTRGDSHSEPGRSSANHEYV